jgi:hypothetical protein
MQAIVHKLTVKKVVVEFALTRNCDSQGEAMPNKPV